ncbi:MAG: Bax inhibitor-1/YccA family protein [Phycisphaerae bacterium]|nr:Bax inhibitor-1/YccA family protein [Phycisphaerae bacterium]
MSMFSDNSPSRPFELGYAADDKAVFNFFNAVYAWMCVGLAVSASTGWLVSQNAMLVRSLITNGIGVVFMIGSVAIIWAIQSAARKLQPGLATVLFLVYAAIVGAIFSGIFVYYPIATIGGAFIMTAGVFGGMSVYGFVTKRDLSSMGSFLIMAVWGLFLATLVNIFVASNGLSWILTYAILGVFILLTAYDTQRLKIIAEQVRGNARGTASYAIIGSLQLYLDFVNMFLSILRIMGDRR